ncbi:MAG TPA: c-type cytochrome [Tepidisphaeraceae bacterium]|nr:c-type cytochrome [Tepidisphaeraceae bacterium]
MTKPIRWLLLLGVVGLVAAQTSRSIIAAASTEAVPPFTGAAPAKPPALAAASDKTAPGVAATFEAGGNSDFRSSRLIALNVPAGQAPSALLPPGPFKATFTAELTQRFRMDATLSAQGRGTLKVSVNGEEVLQGAGDDLSRVEGKVAKLKRGKNQIVAEYTSPAEGGDAVMRLMWSSKEFLPESIPPTLLTHDLSEPLREHARIRDGRELFATLRCAKCHTPTGDAAIPLSDVMPELAMDAPNLSDAGTRLNAGWMARWIADPASIRPDASMPRVLHGEQSPQQAADIAAYLASLGKQAVNIALPDEKAAAAGARLFAGLGCVSCHTIPPADATAEPLRRSLKYVKQKYHPAALFDFLKAPQQHYAWIRMPDFKLSDEEATQLTAFLLSRAEDEAGQAAPAGDPARGKALFASSGCASCHTGAGESTLDAPKLDALVASDWTRGCPTPADHEGRGDAPVFNLTDDQRGALLAFAAAGFESLNHRTVAEAAERQITQLNCVACHVRDKQQDVWSSLKGEIDAFLATLPPAPPSPHEHELAPDQNRPNLTWAGEKLKPEWMAKFIAGEIPYKPRPWIFARMPAFPARAGLLARGMAAQHGCSLTDPPLDTPDVALIEPGRKLAGREGGFSCNTCHAVGDTKAHSAFEAPAPNFAYVSARLRDEFYHRWVRNPQRVEPGTRMPTFADGDGKTALKDLFDGDAAKQFEAIRHYLLQGEAIQPAE